MLENQDMSAPIKLAEGYNPFSDEEVVAQAQPQVDVAPTAPIDEPNTDQQSAQSNEPKQENQEPTTTTTNFDPNQFVKERFGYESVEQAEEEFKKFKEYPNQAFAKKEKIVLIDINQASKEDLIKIYGIGEAISLRILKQKENLLNSD